jgi:hypothetical protein
VEKRFTRGFSRVLVTAQCFYLVSYQVVEVSVRGERRKASPAKAFLVIWWQHRVSTSYEKKSYEEVESARHRGERNVPPPKAFRDFW